MNTMEELPKQSIISANPRSQRWVVGAGLIIIGVFLFFVVRLWPPKPLANTPEIHQTDVDSRQDERRARLDAVEHWAYQIQKLHEGAALERMVESSYQMVVIDDARTIADNTDYDQAGAVRQLKESGKLVIAYVDIGEAEDYRYYWQAGWRIGNPEWIIDQDPDGWEGNYPVKYWNPAWQQVLFGSPESYIDQILADGFDGIYLDWIEAATFYPIEKLAGDERRNAEREMITLITKLAAYARTKQPDFLVIAQNGVELGSHVDYLQVIDGLAQEQVWFDGEAAEEGQPGDIVMPAETIDEECQPVCSTTYYLKKIAAFQAVGLPIFTVDYATQLGNVSKAYDEALRHGFKPYVATRQLDRLTNFPPPGYSTNDL